MVDWNEHVPFGSTGLEVSRLGIGSSFVSDAAIVEEAVERGINYLYWGSIRRPAFGKAVRNLARRNREGLVLTIQSYSRVAALMGPSVEIGLRRAGVEYFDFLLLGMWNQPPSPRLVEAAQRLQAEGKVRHLMLSTHNRPSLQGHFESYAAGESPFDVFMLRYNAVHRGAEQDVFPFLPERARPGMIAYTATRWGHLLDESKMPAGVKPPAARDCYRFALTNEAVSMVLCGPADRAQMREAMQALDAGPLSEEELDHLRAIGDHVYGKYSPQFAERGDANAA